MSNNSSLETIPRDVRLIHNVLATIVSIFGIVLNLIILLAILRYRLYKQTVIVFIVNLSVLYCISSGFSVAYIAYNSFTIYNSDSLNPMVCRAFGFITYTISGAELTALCLISFNRYCLIVYMEKYNAIYGKRSNVLIMLFLSWLLYFVLFLLPTTEIWGKMIYDKNRFLCQPFLYGDSFSKFIAYFSVGSTAPPLVFCYIGIIWKVNSTRNKLNKVSDTHTSRRPKRMPFMIIFILTTFGVLYLPFIFVQGTDPDAVKYNIRIHLVTVYIAWVHLLCNPIIYAVFNQHIQTALKKLFCLKVKNEIFAQTHHTLDVQINVVASQRS